MTNDEINRLAMQDAKSESPEGLRAASDIYDRIIKDQSRVPADMIQDDIWGTNLPNGMLRWFGFDFDWADLPSEPILRRGDPTTWVGTPPGFTFKSGISDAKVTIETDELQESDDAEEREATHVTPKGYIVTVEAHGLDRAEVFTCPSWHEVSAEMPEEWNTSWTKAHMERHHLCDDMDGNLTPEACWFCERGMAGG